MRCVQLITTPAGVLSCVLCKYVVAYTAHNRCVVYQSYQERSSVWPFLFPPPPRSGRDVMRAWGCIASVAVSLFPQTDCRVPQTSLICTSIELSPCSEHLVRCGRSAVVLGSGVRDLGCVCVCGRCKLSEREGALIGLPHHWCADVRAYASPCSRCYFGYAFAVAPCRRAVLQVTITM